MVSPDGPSDIELLLEPNNNPVAMAYQKALFEQGIAAATFFVDDIEKEYERMTNMGATFPVEPTKMEGAPTIAVFDDTCGNLIQICQVQRPSAERAET